ncbi:hypothetical protein [Nitrospirillum amazonense]|uniref:Uncharacterized protein n=1 Tax=Nitrospirillum amazonense TaxID=28077 RepID=A0A560KHF7_9PROT|nr:hypothetical protein [Nitrospirillum amazonense]MDG3443136.1 hypothetical protein [Nitrospirillum amazonense]TWB82723.1 hypothetical protein FBZ87_101433 [Nitrospirillum amazonense]
MMPAPRFSQRQPVLRLTLAFLILAFLTPACWAVSALAASDDPVDTGGLAMPGASVPAPLVVHALNQGTAPAYVLKVLKLALDKSGRPYVLKVDNHALPTAQVLRLLEQPDNGTVDVYWLPTAPALEAHFQPVRVPLDRGLMGYRLLAVNEATQAKINAGTPLSPGQLSLAQGQGWPEAHLLRAAGQTVHETAGNLYNEVATGGADAVPRSSLDIDQEVERAREAGVPVTVARDVALFYRDFYLYFFVAKHDDRLADMLQDGLYQAYADGSFMALFRNDPQIRAAMAYTRQGRRVLALANPDATTPTRAIAASLTESLE